MGKSLGGAVKAIGGAVLGPVGGVLGGLGGLKDVGFGPQQADLSGMNAVQQQALAASQQQQQQLNQLQPQQVDFAKQLADQALGKGPSLADASLRAAQDRNLSQQLAMAKTLRAPNAGLASRNLMNMGAQQAQATNQAAAQAKLAEQQQQQAAFANYLQGQQAYNANLLSGAGQTAGAMANADAQRAASSNQFLGNLIGTGASLGAVAISDENLKTDIKPVTGKKNGNDKKFDSKSFLDGLQAYSYKYKNPAHGDPRISVMAQDLEKTQEGRAMVVNTAAGKMVDYAKGYGTILAAQADLNKRLAEIESKYSKNKKIKES